MNTYIVNVKLNAVVSFSVAATSLENAVEQAKRSLPDQKFIAKGIEYIDGSEEIIGVATNTWYE